MARSINPVQDSKTPEKERRYLRDEHENKKVIITSAYCESRTSTNNTYWHGTYTLEHTGRKLYRVPRKLLVWLDGKAKVFVDNELLSWKKRINTQNGHYSKCTSPQFNLHRTKFIKHCLKSAGSTTVDGYHADLLNHVFPFFIGKLHINNANKWSNHYHQFDDFLESRLNSADARNSVRTSLTLYLKFLYKIRLVKREDLPPREKIRRTKENSPVIPGNLPEHEDILQWLKSLPSGYNRWTISMLAIFGVRISEALVAIPEHFIGEKQLELQKQRNDIVKEALSETYKNVKISMFFWVNMAKKRELRKSTIRNLLPEPSSTPKAGDYTVCCTYPPYAEFIVDMISNSEHIPKPDDKQSQDEARSFLVSSKPITLIYPFNEYRLHDFRRLVITLQSFDFSLEFVSKIYHEDLQTTKRYFQWGQAERQRQKGTKFSLINT